MLAAISASTGSHTSQGGDGTTIGVNNQLFDNVGEKGVFDDVIASLTPTKIRVGNGTKLVFTGDPYQIDNPYVDSSSNGFNYVVSRFRDQAIAAHIELQKGERSELAELAANIL